MLNFSSLKDRKTGTPNRRLSVNHTSPNAGTIIYRPTSQSPANIVSTNVGNEFNTTLVGSNNISLNKVICLVFRRFKQYLTIFLEGQANTTKCKSVRLNIKFMQSESVEEDDGTYGKPHCQPKPQSHAQHSANNSTSAYKSALILRFTGPHVFVYF